MGINVLWLSKCTYSPGYVGPAHTHSVFHYMYIISGTANLLVGENEYLVQEDELYLTPAGGVHGYSAEETAGLKTLEVKFEVHNRELAAKLSGLVDRIKFSDFKIRHILENLISEGLNKDPYYNDVINIKFLEILMYLLRNRESLILDEPGLESDIHPENIRETILTDNTGLQNVLSYMERNIAIPLDLDTLAKVSGMAKFHFSRVFRSSYGITPMQYLNRLRMSRAKELMRYSDQNITQIANSIGFEDVHYFSRFFKQKENLTPYEYLKKVRGNLYFLLDDDVTKDSSLT